MRIRIRWSDFEYNSPIKIIITDWANLKTMFNNSYLLVDSIMEYKGKEIELCVPYRKFVYCIRKLRVEKQRLIINNKAVIEIMKTYIKDNGGMVIKSVEEWDKNRNI